MKPWFVKKAAVLGAGNMGAQIAAHLANAGVGVLLYDRVLEDAEKGTEQLARVAIQKLPKLSPSPLALASFSERITACTYESDMALLADCELIIEAIVEQVEIKQALYQTLAPALNDQAVFVSNTSGLSLEVLASALPTSLQPRFFGMHFFNPPRYLPLVEFIPHPKTEGMILDQVETWLVHQLGKAVIRTKDTPNFIANRIGMAALLSACYYAGKFGLGFDTVDQLTGVRLGRPKSATFRTLDFVGLDVVGHVAQHLQSSLQADPWTDLFKLPAWLQKLLAEKAYGTKSGRGVYQKTDADILVWDITQNAYRPANKAMDEAVKKILKASTWSEKLPALKACDHPQAQFIWHVLAETLLYAAYHGPAIAHSVRDIDLALKWGFGWSHGPFEMWQEVGWQKVADWLADFAPKSIAQVSLPTWVQELKDDGVYHIKGDWSFDKHRYVTAEHLPIYNRQWQVQDILFDPKATETILFENAGLVARQYQRVCVVSFKTKLCVINEAVLQGLLHVTDLAEEQGLPIVIWQPGEHFSAGADLMAFAQVFMLGGAEVLEPIIDLFHQAFTRLRYCQVPVVAATKGYVLGGGCELMLHCDRVVAALESYIGLVEVGVGLIPGAGGCKTFARRSAEALSPDKQLYAYFEHVAKADVAKSAFEAKEMRYLQAADQVVMNSRELLATACEVATQLYEQGYTPPMPKKFKVHGKAAYANICTQLTNLHAGGYISDYDLYLTKQLAEIFSGGLIEAGSEVDEAWMNALEKRVFLQLAGQEKTHARIQHMLETGKPLRN